MGILIEKKQADNVEYVVFENDSFKRIAKLQAFFPRYEFNHEEDFVENRTYYDLPTKLLEKNDLSICKVSSPKGSYAKVEKESTNSKVSFFSQLAEKSYIVPLKPREKLISQIQDIGNGIQSMFSTTLKIDLDYVIKNMQPSLRCEIKKNVFKIFSGNGMKMEMMFETINFQNLQTKRNAVGRLLKIELKSAIVFRKQFVEFVQSFEKYCKEITETSSSKWQYAQRLTATNTEQKK